MPLSQTSLPCGRAQLFTGDASAMHAAPAVESGDDEGCGSSLDP